MSLFNDTVGNSTLTPSNASVPAPHKLTTTEGGILNGIGPLQNDLPLLLVQILVIQVMVRLISLLLLKLRQPRVIAEVIAGILLGPSAFGQIPGFKDTLFPDARKDNLKLFADFGLLLFMFIVGLELDLGLLKTKIRRAFLISIAGMVLPFGLGAAVSMFLWTFLMEDKSKGLGGFILFIGVAMSITAFPVLARILTELKLLGTSVGITTISAAAVDDAAAWCFLALVIAIIASSSPLNCLYIFLMAIGYALFMFIPVRIGLSKLINSSINGISQKMVVVAFMICVCSGYITDFIGIHSIFGGFIAGLVMPRKNDFTLQLTEKVEDLVAILFLPLYFAFSGLRTNIASLNSGMAWGGVVLVIVAACFGKIVGCTSVSRLTGLGWRESFSIGILMNTKGLVELIVLNIGLETGVINVTIFTVMVIMALTTTFLTVPIISLIYPPKYRTSVHTSFRLAPSGITQDESATTILLCIPSVKSIGLMINLIQMMAGKPETRVASSNLNIHAVRMIEVTDRESSVLMATHLDHDEFWAKDTATDILKRFAELNEMEIQTHLTISSADSFATDVDDIVEANEIDVLFVPWPHPHHNDSHRGVNGDNPDIMFADIYQNSSAKVAIVIDSGVRTVDHSKKLKVLVPFAGGSDDREALTIALRLASHPGAEVHILQVSSSDSLSQEDNNVLDHVKSENEDNIFFVKQRQDDLHSSVLDEIATNIYFLVVLGNPTANQSQGGIRSSQANDISLSVIGSLGHAILKVDPHVSLLVIKS